MKLHFNPLWLRASPALRGHTHIYTDTHMRSHSGKACAHACIREHTLVQLAVLCLLKDIKPNEALPGRSAFSVF